MTTNIQRQHESNLGQLVDQICERLQAGKMIELDVLIEQHPEMAEQLSQIYPTLLAMTTWDPEVQNQRLAVGEMDQIANLALGDFRIKREIGRGGMGIVYEAEQLSVSRVVALKVLPLASLIVEKARQRFHVEVRAAATLDHPSIVTIYTVGEERGIHYYAMQLIRGQSLSKVIRVLRTATSQSRSLHGQSIDDAIAREAETDSVQVTAPSNKSNVNPVQTETVAKGQSRTDVTKFNQAYFRNVCQLIMQVAGALHHAHERGVIHRDIKPGNLLLDEHGNIFVSDFGLARIETDPSMTMTGDMLGTLRYMSPEQILSKRVVIDHRTDVYSLGATLYELLTLQPMVTAEGRPQIIKQISLEDPTSPRKLNGAIPADLETIVLKATRKDPDERYASAQDMCDDLARYLENKPIAAKRPTAVQRISKWTRRNPTIMWATVATLLIAIISLSASNFLISLERKAKTAALTEAQESEQRAQQNFQSARQAVDDYLTAVSQDVLLNTPSLLPLRTKLLTLASEYYQGFAQEHADDPDLRLELVAAYRRLVDASIPLRLFDQVDTTEQKIEKILEQLVAENPDSIDLQVELSRTYLHRKEYFQHSKAFDEAAVYLQKAREIADRLNETSREPEVRYILAGVQTEEGEQYMDEGDIDSAFESYAKAIKMRKQLVADFPDVKKYRSTLAASSQWLGRHLQTSGKISESLAAYESSLEQRRLLKEQNPDQMDLLQKYITELNWVAWALVLNGQYEESLLLAETAREILEQLVQENPSVIRYHHLLGVAWNTIGNSQCNLGQLDESVASLRKALTIIRIVATLDPDRDNRSGMLTSVLNSLGITFSEKGDYEAELEVRREFLSVAHDRVKQLSTESNHSKLILAYGALAKSLVKLGREQEAEQAFNSGIEYARSNNISSWNSNYVATQFGKFLADQQRYADVENLIKPIFYEWNQMILGGNEYSPTFANYTVSYGLLCEASIANGHPRKIETFSLEVEQATRKFFARHSKTDNGENLYLLATVAGQSEELGKLALELAQQVVESDPEKWETWRALGAALFRTCDYEGSVRALNKALEMVVQDETQHDSSNAGEAHLILAMANWHLDDPERADNNFESATRLFVDRPNSSSGKRLRAEAEELLKRKRGQERMALPIDY